VTELTGLPAETVTGLQRAGEDGWAVTVEALELARVPSTMDVLGTYEVTLSDEGELLGLRHLGRHRRSATGNGRS
jgi:hypothetical protein